MPSAMAVEIADPPPRLAYEHWPLRDEPAVRWTAWAVLAATGLAAYAATGKPALAAAAVGCVALAAWRMWLPARYELDASGVVEQVLRRKRRASWRAARGAAIGRRGVLVTYRPEPAPADYFRGLFVPFGAHRQEVLRHFRYYAGLALADQAATQSTVSLVRAAEAPQVATPPPPTE